MPRKRSVSNREYKQLSWVGGNSGRFQFHDSNWNFDDVCHHITPTIQSNTTANATTSDDPSYSEEEAESTNEEEVENQSVSSSNDSLGESLCTNDSTVSNKAEKHNANIIIHLPNLETAINSVACCKLCAKSTTITTVEAFVEFCESEQEKILHSCKSMPIGDEIEYLRNEMNVRRFLNKWKANNNPRCTTVPINIREPNTFGMATSFQLQCGCCKCLGNNDNWWRNHASMYEAIKRTMDVLAAKSELCHYDINLRLCLAMQLMGVGGEHARTLTSFLDLPESHKWPHNFRVLEQFLHPAVEELKHESQVQAVQQEIIMTNVPGSLIDQNLLEAELPWF
jgi:hypothetical protein